MRIQYLVPWLQQMLRRRPALVRRLQGSRFGRRLRPVSPASSESIPSGIERRFDDRVSGPGIWKWRHYFPIYDRYLSKFVGQDVHMVEIGVFSGGSLGLWRDHFGSRATIHGVDIDPACLAYQDERIHIHIGDQADPAFWRGFLREVPTVDVVIDDGGHEAYQQIATLEALLPHVRPGGVYLCEDIHGRHHDFHAYLEGLARHLHAHRRRRAFTWQRPSPVQQAIDAIHLHPYVAVIEVRGARLDQLASTRHGTQWRPVRPARRDGESAR